MNVIKKLEQGYRQIRSYVQPSHYKSAQKARQLAVVPPTDKRICLFDFYSIKIDKDMGRYAHHLVTEFESLGYHIAFTNNFRFLATMESKAFKRLIFNRSYSILSLDQVPANCKVLVTDSDREEESEQVSSSFENVVRINYGEKRAPEELTGAVELPYFVHPEVHDSHQVEALHQREAQEVKPPLLRVLFAGNAKAQKYDSPIFKNTYKMMSRVKVIETLKDKLLPAQLRLPQSTESIIPENCSKTVTIATTQSCPIPSSEWINTLNRADFYLACPGVGMPLSHNLIEALAAGAIPILQYPQYLEPPLENGVNCLTFNNEEELLMAVNKALEMNDQDLARLHQNAETYYRENLTPGSLAKKLICSEGGETHLYLSAYHVPRPFPDA